MEDVYPVFWAVSSKLGESEIVGLDGHQDKIFEAAGEGFRHAGLILFRKRGYADVIQKETGAFHQIGAFAGESEEDFSFAKGRYLYNVEISGWAVEAIHLGDYETADAIEPGGLGQGSIQFVQKELPVREYDVRV
jgi:hypothetical protein